jgi:hypothetical protein
MRLRSWHIALLGIVIQAGLGLWITAGVEPGTGFGGFIARLLGLLLLIGSAWGIIPLLLLFFPKTRKVGAVISLIFGVAGIVILRSGLIVGIFLIIAGILSLWKKI